jgi:zinc finger CCHC domain-containing protein 9
MTRFARKGGVSENKESKKKKEDATNWNNMFNPDNNESDTEELTKKRKHEEDYDKRIELENENSVKKNTKKINSNKTEEELIEMYSKSIDKEVLDDLIDLKKSGKITHDEFEDKLFKESRSNQRRLNRQYERESTRVCFKCRKPGHSMSECPEMKKSSEEGAGICYKCGSTEHSVNRCKVKTEPG